MADQLGRFTIVVTKGDSLRFTRIGCSEFCYGVSKSGNIKIQLKEFVYKASGSKGSKIYFSYPLVIQGKVVTQELDNQTVIDKPSQDNGTMIFTKVEIQPALYSNETLNKTLLKDINPKTIKTSGVLRLQFILTDKKVIDSIKILKSYNKKLDKMIIENLKHYYSCYPPLQNGRYIDAVCGLELSINKKNKKISVDVITNDY